MRRGWTRGVKKGRSAEPDDGPILVEGAEPGDALRVDIIRIYPVRGTGWTRGALSANVVDPEAVRDLPPRDRVEWLIDREASTVRLEKPEIGARGLGASDRADDWLLWGCAGARTGDLHRLQLPERRQYGLPRLRPDAP